MHPNAGSRPWLSDHALKKAEQDADLTAWSPANVREFNATLERRVTDRTRELEEAERRFRAIFHSQFQFIGLMAPDGTLLEAWASLKSVRPKDAADPPGPGGANPSVDFRGERRTNETHASRTDPEARLARKGKGKEAKLCFTEYGLIENRHGSLVDACRVRQRRYSSKASCAVRCSGRSRPCRCLSGLN